MKYAHALKRCVEWHKPSKWNLARHEVGHALVAARLNYLPITRVEIWRRNGSYVWSGQLDFDSSGVDVETAPTELLAKSAMVAVAGVLAIDPTLKRKRLIDRIPPSDWAMFSFAICRLADDDTEDAVFESVTTKTATILKNDGASLDAITRRLCRKKYLDGEEIVSILKAPGIRNSTTD